MKTPQHPPRSRTAGRHPRFFTTASRLFVSLLIPAAAIPGDAATLYGLAADREVDGAGVISNASTMRAGYSGSTGINPVVVFQLPALPAGQEFSAASIRLYFQSLSGTPTFNGDLYGIGASASPAVLSTDYFAGALDAGSVLIQDNLVTPASGTGPKVSSAAALTDYLNAAYANGAGAGQYVFFRVNPDVAGLTNNFTRYNAYSAEAPGGSYYYPSINYSTADAQVGWTTVPLGGGGFVTGLVSDATGNDIYCRTDAGGSLKWNASTGAWVSITDTIVPTTTAKADSLMHTLSIAIDPNNTDNLYVAAGSRTPAGTLHGIYASGDKGATWTAINTSLIIEGNGSPSSPFRSCGERLAVDPNNSNILWYGSSDEGLWKAVKSGGTWTWTQIPSTSVPFGQVASGEKAGVIFVACDKNGTSTIIYAGVFDSVAGGTTGGVYQSLDGGDSWTKVGGTAISMPKRATVAANGTLYVTGHSVVGRMLRGGSLAAVTPQVASIDYRAVAVDPNDATGNTVYVSEGSSGTSRIWRTTTGGASWLSQGTTLFNNYQGISRQEPDGTPTLTGYWFGNVSSLLVNPANSSELWAADYFGVSRTQNAQLIGGTTAATMPTWYVLQKGQEETVVEVVKNAPAGAKLMTGLADVGGYRYNDITVRPSGTGGKSFSYPGGGNTNSLDFSEGYQNNWVRAWYGNSGKGTGAYSSDGGVSWLYFGEIARRSVNSGAAGWETWDLTDYLAAQKANGATWITLVLASDNATNFTTASLNFDSKEAADSSLTPRLLINGATTLVVARDTYVSGATANVDTNYGNSATLAVSHAYSSSVLNDRQIYLKFDLTGVPAITSATLQLHRLAATSGITYPVGVFACSNSTWIEGDGGADNLPAGELTWTNKPAPYASGTGKPYADPGYKTTAGVSLNGGRVAISSTDVNNIVWMPFASATVPHYSKDRGVTFTPCAGLPAGINRMLSKANPSYLLQQITADRMNGQFYMAALSTPTGTGNTTVYRSTDGGANWLAAGVISSATYNIYRTQIVAAPAANDVWFSDDGVSDPAKGGLWRSTNGGGDWLKILNGTIKSVRQVTFGKAASGSGYTVFINGYKGGVQGVYRSDDYGANWVRLPDVPTCSAIESMGGDRQNYGRVFIGTHGRGVFVGQ